MAVIFMGQVLADYHQLYLADAAANPDLPTEWSDAALAQRLQASDRVLVLTTARNMTVPVRVELHERAVAVPSTCQHAVAGSLETSGDLLIAGLGDYLPDATRLAVPPGPLRVLVVSFGLDTLSEDGLEGDDHYVVHLRPEAMSEIAVLRQWVEPKA